MGRPLNKKYFGNRNIGTNGYEGVADPDLNSPPHNPAETNAFFPDGDDGIGGEGVRAVYFDDDGLTIGSYLERIPTVTFKAPSLPGGVTATGTVTHVEAVKALIHDRGTGYQIGDVITIVGGTGTAATFRVTKLRVLDVTISDQANSQNFDGGENLVWDSLVDDNWTSPTILANVASTGDPNYDLGGGDGSRPYTIGMSSFGVWDGYVGSGPALAPATLTITGGGDGFNTRGARDTNGGLGDNNGSGGIATFTYGIEAVEVVTGGDYTVVPNTISYVASSGTAGIDATLDVYYGVKTVVITEKGSGYIDGADAVPTFEANNVEDGDEAQAIGATYLTYDAGAGTGYRQGNANNQDNAIIAYVWQDGERRIADIVKQTGSKRFVCITNAGGFAGDGKEDETVYGYLQSHIANGPKQIDITATDANGNTYFVTKMTAHKATLVRRDRYVAGTTYNATGYIDNNMNGGNGEGETFHLVSADTPGPINLDGAVLTWTTTPTQGSAYTTTISGDTMGSGEYGYVTYYVPGAHVYLGDHNNPVAMTMTLGGAPAEWLFETGDRVEWTFASNPDNDQVTIENA